MNKKIMIPFMGLAMVAFVGCSDAPAPGYNPPANPAPTQFQNQGQMVNYCKGMIAGEANTKPINVQMESLVIEKGIKPGSKVSGTVYGKKYTCEFDTQGKYFDIHPAY